MNLSAKNIFLVDAIGALITSILLSQVLANFEDFFGMPKQTLWLLAAIAFLFFLYSFTCHFFFRESFKTLLRGIIFANITYCLLTTILVLNNLDILTKYGILYFVGEIIVVLFLVKQEYKIIKLSNE